KPLRDIKGIYYKENNKIKKTEKREPITNLDHLPQIIWEDVDLSKYQQSYERGNFSNVGAIMTSRGCGFNCDYCCSESMYGSNVRFRSNTNIIEELETLKKNHNVKFIEFWDDTFTLGYKKRTELFTYLRKKGIHFSCNARADTVDEECIKILTKAGCKNIFFGIESANPNTLKDLGRSMDQNKITNAFKLAKKYGLKTIGSFMFGAPNENLASVHQTIALAKKLNPDRVLFNIVTAHPGTKLYKRCVEEKIIPRYKVDPQKYAKEPIGVPSSCKNINREKLQRLKFQAYKEYYVRPKFIISQLLKCRSITEIKTLIDLTKTYKK
ncbi:radical SAM protein, partial [Candidatus Woesearchaeota archaeon]|nr:radical SAM protein [Candidatus Woesearchaeota archaeon]